MKRLFIAALLALLSPFAWADTFPTVITPACGLAVNGSASQQLYAVGTLSEFVTVTKTAAASQSYTSAQCGSAQIRSNSGSTMTDTLASPAAGYRIYIANADASAADTVSTPSGTITNGTTTAPTMSLTAGQTAELASDGTNYYVIGGSTVSSGGGGCATTGCAYTGPLTITGGSATLSGNTLGLQGAATMPTPSGNGQGAIGLGVSSGLTLIGKGGKDITFLNSTGASACSIPTGATYLSCGGLAVSPNAGTTPQGGFNDSTLSTGIVGAPSVNDSGNIKYLWGTLYSATTNLSGSPSTASPMNLLGAAGLGSTTIQPFYMYAGRVVHVHVGGLFLLASSPGTVTLTLNWGSQAMISGTPITLSGTASASLTYTIDVWIECLGSTSPAQMAVTTQVLLPGATMGSGFPSSSNSNTNVTISSAEAISLTAVAGFVWTGIRFL
jgi:hypothetical protein